jgi:hypothetical protein
MVTTPAQYIEPVMFMCEAKGVQVSTGHRMRAKELEALTGPRSFRCRACGAIHTWTRETAWLGQRQVVS